MVTVTSYKVQITVSSVLYLELKMATNTNKCNHQWRDSVLKQMNSQVIFPTNELHFHECGRDFSLLYGHHTNDLKAVESLSII